MENAFNILCTQRKDYSAYADIWDLRYNWQCYKQQIITQIKTSIFDFDPATQYTANNEICYKRTARDALVLKAIKVTCQALKPWGYQLHTNEKTYIGKIAKGFDFCGFRLSYDKIILAKSCLAKFEKRLSKLYEQLSKCKRSSYKNTFTTTALF